MKADPAAATGQSTRRLAFLAAGVVCFHVFTSLCQNRVFHLPNFSNVLLLSFGEMLMTAILSGAQLVMEYVMRRTSQTEGDGDAMQPFVPTRNRHNHSPSSSPRSRLHRRLSEQSSLPEDSMNGGEAYSVMVREGGTSPTLAKGLLHPDDQTGVDPLSNSPSSSVSPNHRGRKCFPLVSMDSREGSAYSVEATSPRTRGPPRCAASPPKKRKPSGRLSQFRRLLRDVFHPSTVPMGVYVAISLFMACSLFLTNHTSFLLSYALQVIFKSSKLLSMVLVRRFWPISECDPAESARRGGRRWRWNQNALRVRQQVASMTLWCRRRVCGGLCQWDANARGAGNGDASRSGDGRRRRSQAGETQGLAGYLDEVSGERLTPRFTTSPATPVHYAFPESLRRREFPLTPQSSVPLTRDSDEYGTTSFTGHTHATSGRPLRALAMRRAGVSFAWLRRCYVAERELLSCALVVVGLIVFTIAVSAEAHPPPSSSTSTSTSTVESALRTPLMPVPGASLGTAPGAADREDHRVYKRVDHRDEDSNDDNDDAFWRGNEIGEGGEGEDDGAGGRFAMADMGRHAQELEEEANHDDDDDYDDDDDGAQASAPLSPRKKGLTRVGDSPSSSSTPRAEAAPRGKKRSAWVSLRVVMMGIAGVMVSNVLDACLYMFEEVFCFGQKPQDVRGSRSHTEDSDGAREAKKHEKHSDEERQQRRRQCESAARASPTSSQPRRLSMDDCQNGDGCVSRAVSSCEVGVLSPRSSSTKARVTPATLPTAMMATGTPPIQGSGNVTRPPSPLRDMKPQTVFPTRLPTPILTASLSTPASPTSSPRRSDVVKAEPPPRRYASTSEVLFFPSALASLAYLAVFVLQYVRPADDLPCATGAPHHAGQAAPLPFRAGGRVLGEGNTGGEGREASLMHHQMTKTRFAATLANASASSVNCTSLAAAGQDAEFTAYGELTLLVIVAACSSLAGTLCLLRILRAYNSTTAVLVTSVRKTVTIFCTYIQYGRPFSLQHTLGLMCVMGGVYWYETSRREEAKFHQQQQLKLQQQQQEELKEANEEDDDDERLERQFGLLERRYSGRTYPGDESEGSGDV